MAVSYSTATKNGVLNGTGIKEQLDAGFLYIFSGTVPATADDALNMATTHTLLVKISLSAGATGLTWASPSGGSLNKNSGETWSGTASFSGVNSGTSPQAPTFFRFCTASDNGQGAANTTTGYRIQGSVTVAGGGGDLQLGASTITNGALQTIGSATVTVRG